MAVETISAENVIAVRILSLNEQPVEVLIAKPEKAGEDYLCKYQIKGVGDQKIKSMAGIDGVHALQLTLKVLAAEVVNLKSQYPLLRWEDDPTDSLGF